MLAASPSWTRWFNSEAPFGLHVNPIVPLLSDDVLGDRRKLRNTNHADSCRFRPWIRFRRDDLDVRHPALPVEPECSLTDPRFRRSRYFANSRRTVWNAITL